MNQLKKLFAVAALTACVLPVAAQYPVIPDSVKIRGEEQQKEIDRKSDEAWAEELAWSELGDYVRKLLRGEDSG